MTVSMSGMPSRSVRQTMRWPRSETSRQESSSTLTWVIADLATAKRQAALDADDGGALEAGRNRPVEVLLAGDVDLVDDVAAEHQALLDGDVDGLLIDEKRRRVVHLVGADVGLVEQIDDVLSGLELHQRRAVVLAELGQGRPHVAQDRAVVLGGVEPRRTVAEHLLFGEQLLVDLEADPKTDLGVVDGVVQDPSRAESVDDSRGGRLSAPR